MGLNKNCARINIPYCANIARRMKKNPKYGKVYGNGCPDMDDMQPWFKYLSLRDYTKDHYSQIDYVGTVCGVRKQSNTMTCDRQVPGNTCRLRGADMKLDAKKVMLCENLERLTTEEEKKKNGVPKALWQAKTACQVARDASFQSIRNVHLTINYGHENFKGRVRNKFRWKHCDPSTAMKSDYRSWMLNCTAKESKIWNEACGSAVESMESFNEWVTNRQPGLKPQGKMLEFWWNAAMASLEGAALSL